MVNLQEENTKACSLFHQEKLCNDVKGKILGSTVRTFISQFHLIRFLINKFPQDVTKEVGVRNLSGELIDLTCFFPINCTSSLLQTAFETPDYTWFFHQLSKATITQKGKDGQHQHLNRFPNCAEGEKSITIPRLRSCQDQISKTRQAGGKRVEAQSHMAQFDFTILGGKYGRLTDIHLSDMYTSFSYTNNSPHSLSENTGNCCM